MPTAEQLRQFLVTVVIPPIAGGISTWLFTNVHFLSIFHINADQTARAITELAVFGVSAGLAWLASHHILRGNYAPGAKTARSAQLTAVEYSGTTVKGTK